MSFLVPSRDERHVTLRLLQGHAFLWPGGEGPAFQREARNFLASESHNSLKSSSSPTLLPVYSINTMQMIKGNSRVFASRAPRSLVARAIEPPQAPTPSTTTDTDGVVMSGECA